MTKHMESPEDPRGGDAPQPPETAAGASEHDLIGEQQPVGTTGTELFLPSSPHVIYQNSPIVQSMLEAQRAASRYWSDFSAAASAAAAFEAQVAETVSVLQTPFDYQSLALPKIDLTLPPIFDLGVIGKSVLDVVGPASWVSHQFDDITNSLAMSQLTMRLAMAEIANINSVISTASAWTVDLGHLHRAIADATRWALRPIVPSVDEADRVLRSLLLAAAKRARQDFLTSGDPKAASEFAFRWLGLKPARRFRETTLNAVVEVLLGEVWDASEVPAVPTHGELWKHLRARVADAHRRWRPTWTHKVEGLTIGSLNVRTPLPDGGKTELVHLVPGETDVEAAALRGLDSMDDRLRVPLKALSPVEQQVAWMVANGLTWAEAAVVVGLPDNAGLSIERKAQRRAREYVARQRARAETVNRTATR